MKLYVKKIAPVLYYPGQNYEVKEKFIEDPVVWHPEDMREELQKKYNDLNSKWETVAFRARYEEYAEEPKFKNLKVPEKCKDCKSIIELFDMDQNLVCYCNMKRLEENLVYNDISTIRVNPKTRPDWCPIVKLNQKLDEMPIEQRQKADMVMKSLSAMFGADNSLE